MKILFIFLDGVGLGGADPSINPLVHATLPNLDILLDGNKIIADDSHAASATKPRIVHTSRASLLALDACLGIEGVPQSASGQASLLTGRNVAGILGGHDGPKPNPIVMEILRQGNIFSWMSKNNLKSTLLNAYPPRYFTSIENGHRLPGVIALAARYAGMRINTQDDLAHGRAISADFTADGWRDHLGLVDTPLLNPHEAGERISTLADESQLAFFEYWLTDVAGHHQDMQSACKLLELFDVVLGSLVNSWEDERALILITSDHGNIEDLSTRHHTRNDVPLLLIGSQELRQRFIAELLNTSKARGQLNLTDIAPAIVNLI